MADRWGGGPSAVLNKDMRGAVARLRTPPPVSPATRHREVIGSAHTDGGVA